MEDTKAKILDSIRETGSYHYSSDPEKKNMEINAIKELETNGSITSITKALGYVNAKVL